MAAPGFPVKTKLPTLAPKVPSKSMVPTKSTSSTKSVKSMILSKTLSSTQYVSMKSHFRGMLAALAVLAAALTPTEARATPDPAATTLRFSTAPGEARPIALYRAPAPYQEAGKRPLNSVIITSKPYSINEQRHMMATTAPAPTAATAESRSSSSDGVSENVKNGISAFWRRHMPTTTERPSVTLHIPQYSIDCAEGQRCSETIAVDENTAAPTFKPYPQDVLDKFLRDFAAASRLENSRRGEDPPAQKATNRLANLYLDHEDDHHDNDNASSDADNNGGEDSRGDADNVESEETEGKSRWQVIHAQQHHHPYDDADGWVSLEPVPWSTSKVSKWHSSHTKRPGYKPPNRWDTRPPSGWADKPSRPPWEKPTYVSGGDYDSHRPSYWPQKPSSDRWPTDSQRPWDKPEYDYHRPSHWAPAGPGDIITDNRPDRWPDSHTSGGSVSGYRPYPPSNDPFSPLHSSPPHSSPHRPHYDYSQSRPDKRPALHSGPGGYYGDRHPPTHPEESDGQWLLVSSTKGYAVPHRHKIFQRALTFTGRPVSSKRTVRLTVLPALNGTANTTISHGGLLEVESTFQSVEDDQKQQEEEAQQQQQNDVPLVTAVKPKTRGVRFITQQNNPTSSRAVLAAVGAGMVPATMALLAPLVLGRKRRSVTFKPPSPSPLDTLKRIGALPTPRR